MNHYKPDSLIAGDYPIITKTLTVGSNQALSRGALLGCTKDKEIYVLSQAKATDGTEVPSVILAQDIETGKEPIEATCYLSGQFNTEAMTFGQGQLPEKVWQQLRALNIYLTKSI